MRIAGPPQELVPAQLFLTSAGYSAPVALNYPLSLQMELQMNRRVNSLCKAAVLVALLVSGVSSVQAKEHEAYGSKINIDAPAEVVFEAIRKQRNSAEQHRHLESYDGHKAVIKENMENVPIYGKVECLWEETEDPYKRIDYKMLKSTKFKDGFGSWILTPGPDGKGTTLEFVSYTDSGLMVPFAGMLTKNESIKTSKTRLAHIKEVAEAMEKEHPGKEKVSEKDAEKGKSTK